MFIVSALSTVFNELSNLDQQIHELENERQKAVDNIIANATFKIGESYMHPISVNGKKFEGFVITDATVAGGKRSAEIAKKNGQYEILYTYYPIGAKNDDTYMAFEKGLIEKIEKGKTK